MESVLIVVTVISLGLALAMSMVAWTLLRNERERTAARAEALAALAFEDSRNQDAGMSAPIERRAQAHQTHAADDMDVAPLASPSAAPAWDLALRDAAPTGDLFEREPPTGATARRWLAVAAVGLLIVAGYVMASALRRPEVVAAIAASNPAPSSRPIELLSLKHSMDSDGAFVVVGFVQNPADGMNLSGVEAVVYLFDNKDQYFATGRAPLDTPAIRPGDQSPFVVSIQNVSGVNRYRVAFRQADGAVAHVDRRGHLPEGTGDTLPQPEIARPAGGIR